MEPPVDDVTFYLVFLTLLQNKLRKRLFAGIEEVVDKKVINNLAAHFYLGPPLGILRPQMGNHKSGPKDGLCAQRICSHFYEQSNLSLL
jgi:hypothetical protein